jgi:hypothetical protein
MGSKQKAPKVDPSQVRLNNAQADAMYKQQGLNEDIFNWQRQQADQQYAFGLQEFNRQNQLADTAQGWAMEDRLRQDEFRDEAYAYDPTGDARANADQWRNEAMAQSQQSVSDGMGQLGRGLQRMGVNPNSGKYAALNKQAQVTGALGTAANVNAASRAGDLAIQAAKAEKLNTRAMANGMNNAGGYLGMTSGFGLAGLGASGAGMNAMSQAWQGHNQGAGVAQGWGAGATSGFNSVAQQRQFASQNQGGGWGEALGGIAGGLAGSFLGPMGTAAGTKLGNKMFGP